MGNSLIRRLLTDARDNNERFIAGGEDDGYCRATIKLGRTYHRNFGAGPRCSFRAKPGSLFCGQHDHLSVVFGDSVDEWLAEHGTNIDAAVRKAFTCGRILDLRGTRFAGEDADAT